MSVGILGNGNFSISFNDSAEIPKGDISRIARLVKEQKYSIEGAVKRYLANRACFSKSYDLQNQLECLVQGEIKKNSIKVYRIDGHFVSIVAAKSEDEAESKLIDQYILPDGFDLETEETDDYTIEECDIK